ncbi:MAG: PilZ domain-containing protein [Treponema sp.]|jgi:hypothetical protein|nr:PilZ domain-containing protein [Treponema sp.]
MKLLAVLGSDDGWERIKYSLKPLGFDLIRYHHVLKAMDNIDETDPAAIIISAQDFPRHWKTLIQFVRNSRPKEACPIIILRGPRFSETEASQALYLGANGIVENGVSNEAEEEQLQGILSRYIPIMEKRKSRRYHLNKESAVGFLIAHPKDRLIITGEVQNISRGGIFFRPDHIALAGDISLQQELAECSLRVGKAIFSPVCQLIRPGTTLALKFLSFPEKERAAFESSMEKLPLGAAKRRLSPKPPAGRVNINRKSDG